MKYKPIVVFLVLFCTFWSCKKDGIPPDYDQVFSLVNPRTNQEYDINIIEIEGTGDSEEQLVFYVIDSCVYLNILEQTSYEKDLLFVIIDPKERDRERDYVPNDITNTSPNSRNSELDPFSRFIVQDVDSMLRSNQVYHSTVSKGIIADDTKGWAASYFFCVHNDFFDNYIIINPNLYWDQHVFFVYEYTYRPNNKEDTAKVFLGDYTSNDLGNGVAIEAFATILEEEYPNVEILHNIYDGKENLYLETNLLMGLKFILE